MPFKNPQDAHQYKLRWTAERRATWFAGKRCVRCGSTESLQLDHVDPLRKVDHRIWNWATERREVELAKCQPLCEECHKDKTRSKELGSPMEPTPCITWDADVTSAGWLSHEQTGSGTNSRRHSVNGQRACFVNRMSWFDPRCRLLGGRLA